MAAGLPSRAVLCHAMLPHVWRLAMPAHGVPLQQPFVHARGGCCLCCFGCPIPALHLQPVLAVGSLWHGLHCVRVRFPPLMANRCCPPSHAARTAEAAQELGNGASLLCHVGRAAGGAGLVELPPLGQPRGVPVPGAARCVRCPSDNSSDVGAGRRCLLGLSASKV